MKPLLAVIDCGTTSVKAAVVDAAGRLLSLVSLPCPLVRRPDGAVENDPSILRRRVVAALAGAVSKTGQKRKAVAAISVTGQRATLFCLDAGGRPLAPGFNWQDMRGRAETARFAARFPAARFRALTGLPCNTVFSIGKWLYLKARHPELARRTHRLALVNDFILESLGAAVMPTDWPSASLTGFLDTGRLRWCPEILDAAGLDAAMLPALTASGLKVGELSKPAARMLGLSAGLPLIAGAGDQQCAGLGSGATQPGVVIVNVGTGSVSLASTNHYLPDRKNRLMCCAHAVPGQWTLEGLQNSTGSSIAWLEQILGRPFTRHNPVLQKAARLAPGSEGVRFLPYLAGSASPHWYPDASGAFLGLTLAHDGSHLARAILEGLIFDLRETLGAFTALGIPADDIRFTGGYSIVPLWRSLMADVLGRPVRLMDPQSTLLGAAMLAAAGAGLYHSPEEAAARMVRMKQCISPNPDRAAQYDLLFSKYADLDRLLHRSGLFSRLAAEEA